MDVSPCFKCHWHKGESFGDVKACSYKGTGRVIVVTLTLVSALASTLDVLVEVFVSPLSSRSEI